MLYPEESRHLLVSFIIAHVIIFVAAPLVSSHPPPVSTYHCAKCGQWEIPLANVVSANDTEVAKLLQSINAEAQKLKGFEMVFSVCQLCIILL